MGNINNFRALELQNLICSLSLPSHFSLSPPLSLNKCLPC